MTASSAAQPSQMRDRLAACVSLRMSLSRLGVGVCVIAVYSASSSRLASSSHAGRLRERDVGGVFVAKIGTSGNPMGA